MKFDAACRRCERLSDYLDQVKADYPDYHARPVAPFGDDRARLLIVGLAPGLHGANATGRPFTGDHAGILLYRTLYRFGFASAPESLHSEDGLELRNCRITNAVKCLPPKNQPKADEVKACNGFLQAELEAMPAGSVILALGGIAHRAVVSALRQRQARFPFAHAALHELEDGRYLLDSYHCSRYNTQTKRLTVDMFEQVFAQARQLITRETLSR